MPIRVFVYGTLKNGHGNHRLLATSKFLGRSYIEGRYKMLSLGGFPGLVASQSLPEAHIVGEVYQVSEDVFQALDYLEGHPRFYERMKVPTQYKNAWAYFLPEAYLERNYVDAGVCWHPVQAEIEWMAGAPESPVADNGGAL